MKKKQIEVRFEHILAGCSGIRLTWSRFVKMRAEYGTVEFAQILIPVSMKRKADLVEKWGWLFGKSLGRRCARFVRTLRANFSHARKWWSRRLVGNMLDGTKDNRLMVDRPEEEFWISFLRKLVKLQESGKEGLEKQTNGASVRGI